MFRTEDEKEAKKGTRASFDKEVVHFRGRHFEDWLALAMDVSLFLLPLTFHTQNDVVCISVLEAESV